MWNNSLAEIVKYCFLRRNVKWNSPLHICEANISQRSYFTWRSHISLAEGEFRWKKPFAFANGFSGGEGEIRTLEPFYRLHDFQSCALDQLGDFSKSYFVVCCRRSRLTAPLFYHIVFDLSIPFLKKVWNFLKIFEGKKMRIFFKKALDKIRIYGIMKSGMIPNIKQKSPRTR